jgi:hypothetical protein
MMLLGQHLPSWIRAIEDENIRREKIQSLTPDDVFRSQFRAEPKASRSPIEIIDWGLQHIDRLRKAGSEAREEKAKKWTNLWMPLASIILVLVTIVSNGYIQIKSLSTQTELKKYEISLKPKQYNYSLFMSLLIIAYDNAYNNNLYELKISLDKIETAYYNIEPFLGNEWRTAIWGQYQQFSAMCYEFEKITIKDKDTRSKFFDSFLWYKHYFRNNLYQALFGL